VVRIETPVVLSPCAKRYCPTRFGRLGILVGVLEMSSRVAFAMILTSALLVACGSPESDDAGGTVSVASSTPKPPKSSVTNMVAAVSAKPGAGVVDLRFSIAKRPQVGEPVEIELALIPAVDLEQLFARFQVAEGLQLVSGAETEHLEHPAAQVAVGHKLTVIPKTDGIFYITAVVLADSDKESIARNFNIPIIAGQGLAELPPAPAAASVSDPQRLPARP
jgi:hypothetical protein